MIAEKIAWTLADGDREMARLPLLYLSPPKPEAVTADGGTEPKQDLRQPGATRSYERARGR